MGHLGSTYEKYYTPTHITRDFQSIYFGSPSEDLLIESVARMGLSQDRRAPTELDHSERPKGKVSRYTVRPGTLGLTLSAFVFLSSVSMTTFMKCLWILIQLDRLDSELSELLEPGSKLLLLKRFSML
jgi:hypothetical protein